MDALQKEIKNKRIVSGSTEKVQTLISSKPDTLAERLYFPSEQATANSLSAILIYKEVLMFGDLKEKHKEKKDALVKKMPPVYTDYIAEALAFSAAEGGENIQYTRHDKVDVHRDYNVREHKAVLEKYPNEDAAVWLMRERMKRTNGG